MVGKSRFHRFRFAAAVIAAAFAFLLDAPLPLVAVWLVLELFIAPMEHHLPQAPGGDDDRSASK